MNKSKILKEIVWIGGIALCLWVLFFKVLPDELTEIGTTIFGIPYLIWWVVCEKLSMDWAKNLYWLLTISTVFEAIFIRILFSYTFKFKWKYLASLIALLLFILVNIGAWHVLIIGMLQPHWQTYQNDNFHFSMECPYRMLPEQYEKPWKTKIIREAKIETLGFFRLCHISVTCTEYKYGRPSFEKSRKFWQEIVGRKSWKIIFGKVKLSKIVCSGVPAVLIDSDRNYSLDFGKGNFRWFFQITKKNHFEEYYPADVQTMADRVIKSIQIKDIP